MQDYILPSHENFFEEFNFLFIYHDSKKAMLVLSCTAKIPFFSLQHVMLVFFIRILIRYAPVHWQIINSHYLEDFSEILNKNYKKEKNVSDFQKLAGFFFLENEKKNVVKTCNYVFCCLQTWMALESRNRLTLLQTFWLHADIRISV